MPRDGCGQRKHRYLRPKILINNGEDTEADGEPNHHDSDHLNVQRDSAVFAEVADIGTELGVLHKPLIQTR